MQPEYQLIKQALIDRGFAGRPMHDRGDLYETLRLIRAEAPEHEDFVDEMRLLLVAGGDREDLQRLEIEFRVQRGIKGCPVCHSLPSISQGALVSISCARHASAITLQARTFPAALVEWNDSEEWMMDQDFSDAFDKAAERPLYAVDLSAYVLK